MSDNSVTQTQTKRKTKKYYCSVDGCEKWVASGGRCIAHGGGKRCSEIGCTKSAVGKTDLCVAHGGGRRCIADGCTKSAAGETDLCVAHGGGRRCIEIDCTKSAVGKTDFCKAHGGGRRCIADGCTKGARGDTDFCIAHGGGRRCLEAGCTKGAQGKTCFCIAHGGGRRCLEAGCMKSAAVPTDFCKAHGGGRRCLEVGCTTGAKNGTDFCTVHHPDHVPDTYGIKPTDSVIIYLGTDLISGLRFFGIVKVNDAFKLNRLNAAIHHYHSNDARLDHLFYAILDGMGVERAIKAITGRPTGRFPRVITESLFDHQMPEVMSIIEDRGLLPIP